MSCAHPVWLKARGDTVPCGQCRGCRTERSRQWAVRCMHEASLQEENCFATLTYAPEYLPTAGSLVKADFQKFMKRLRKFFFPRKVRFFHAGEYGEDTKRPHYHALLFGVDFADKVVWSKRGLHPVYRSRQLDELWGRGQCEVGSVTFESAAYVARYVMKKISGEANDWQYEVVDEVTGEVHLRGREYATMSRRPGIGRAWLDKYMSDVYPADRVVVAGQAQKPPQYYDKVYGLLAPAEMGAIKEARSAKVRLADSSLTRREVIEQVLEAKQSLSKRGL